MLPDALTVTAVITLAPVRLPPVPVPTIALATILLPVTLPVTLRPLALLNVATAVGVIELVAVVKITTLVARLVSVKASAATKSTRPVELFPNCKVPLLNPRPVN